MQIFTSAPHMGTSRLEGWSVFVLTKSLSPNAWWVPLIYGVVLVALSAMFFFHPMFTITGVVWTIGLFWLLGGIVKMFGLFFDPTQSGWKFFGALVSIIVGLWIVFPGAGAQTLLEGALRNDIAFTSALSFVWVFGGLFVGLSTFMAGYNVKSWPDVCIGIIEMILGLYLVFNIFVMVSLIPFIFGIVALFGGIFAIVAALKARNVEKMIFG